MKRRTHACSEVLRVASEAYDGGAQLCSVTEHSGDTLALFIKLEIDDVCGTVRNRYLAHAEAINAMSRAVHQLNVVMCALQQSFEKKEDTHA